MSADRITMSGVIHGESGTGKSWLGDTVPAPRLVVDVEGRAKHTPSQPKVYWDPSTERPPDPPSKENPWVTCVVKATDWRIIPQVYSWLRSGDHPFKSVVIDSLMEVQKRFIDQDVGTNQMTTQNWGSVLRELESFVRNMRDLVTIDAAHVDVAIIITGSIMDDRNVQRPLLQGQLKNTLPYFVDVVGYLFVAPTEDGMGMKRVLQVAPSPYAVAKDGTGKLGGPQIEEPNLTTLYNNLSKGES